MVGPHVELMPRIVDEVEVRAHDTHARMPLQECNEPADDLWVPSIMIMEDAQEFSSCFINMNRLDRICRVR